MKPKIKCFFYFLPSTVRISFELIQSAPSHHSQRIANQSVTYRLMVATEVGSRPQISADRPPSAHLSLFDTNCTLSGSGRPTAFSSLHTKSALTLGHQRGEEASYLTRHTRVHLDVIKDKNVIFKPCFFSLSPPSTCHPSVLLFSQTLEPLPTPLICWNQL